MDEENNTEDTPARKSDDGTLQDLKVSLRFHVNQIKEAWQEKIKARFGKQVTGEEAMALDNVYSPFDYESPEEMDEDMTEEEYEEARASILGQSRGCGLRSSACSIWMKKRRNIRCATWATHRRRK